MFKTKLPNVVLYANRRAGWRHESWWALDKWALEKNISTYTLTEIEEIESIIKGKIDKLIRLLLVYGGDGTLFWVINNLLKYRDQENIPTIVPVGGGTMKRLCKWTMWTGAPVQNAKTALRLFDSRRLPQMPMRLLSVQWQGQTFYGITFMAGAPIRILEKYSGFKTTPFIAASFCVASVAAGLLQWPSFFTSLYDQINAEVIVDGNKLAHGKYIAVAKDTLERAVFFIKPYRGKCLPDQNFTGAFAIDYRETAQRIIPIVFGWPQKSEKYFNQPTKELILRPKERILFTIDGEFFEAEAGSEIKVGPGKTVPVATNPLLEIPFIDKLEDRRDKVKDIWSYFFPTPRK